MIIRHTDSEVLQEIADILWPAEDPEQQWSPDTIADVANVLAMLRPELLPWSLDCLVDHHWASNAHDCALLRRYQARVDYLHGLVPHEAIYAEDGTIDALRSLYLRWNGDDDDE